MIDDTNTILTDWAIQAEITISQLAYFVLIQENILESPWPW